MHRKLMGLAAAVAATGSLVLAGCSNNVSKADFKAELTKNGVPESYAGCVTDSLEKQGFSFKKYGDLSAEDNAKIQAATSECINKAASDIIGGASIPSIPQGVTIPGNVSIPSIPKG